MFRKKLIECTREDRTPPPGDPPDSYLREVSIPRGTRSLPVRGEDHTRDVSTYGGEEPTSDPTHER